MKNCLKLSFAALLGISAFTSCSKGAKQSNTTQYLTLDSKAIDSFSSSGSMLSVAKNGNKIEITASSTSGKIVYLWLEPYPTMTGKMSLNSTTNAIEYDAIDSTITSAYGTLTITTLTPHITGTFTFTGLDAQNYTGTFDVIAP